MVDDSERSFDNLQSRLELILSEENLRKAFYHTSYVNEGHENLESNERLEFLGDAVIDLATSNYLYNYWESKDEGELSKLKAIIVSQPTLAKKAKELQLGKLLFLGKGEEDSGGREKPSILCDVFEALIGLIFQETSYKQASELVIEILEDEINNLAQQQQIYDYKSALQIKGQKWFDSIPTYKVVEQSGKAHNRTYKVCAHLNGFEGQGRGTSKQEAEQAAAKQLYLTLERKTQDNQRP